MNTLKVNTNLCVDLKTYLVNDRLLRPGKLYHGTLRRDKPEDGLTFDDQHYTFAENMPKPDRRHEHVFRGRFITVTRWDDGSLHPYFRAISISDDFSSTRYAMAVADELACALISLDPRKKPLRKKISDFMARV
jgi:hypothetical protein